MTCYRCGGKDLELTPLTHLQRSNYASQQVVHRTCRDCGLGQNHVGDDEVMDPLVAAQEAPEVFAG